MIKTTCGFWLFFFFGETLILISLGPRSNQEIQKLRLGYKIDNKSFVYKKKAKTLNILCI